MKRDELPSKNNVPNENNAPSDDALRAFETHWLTSAREQANFDRLWSRIEYNEAITKKTFRQRWISIAMAATVLAAVALSLYKTTGNPDTMPGYRTLADSGTRVACGQLRVRFIDNFSAADMQALLQSVDAHIVDGPTPHGVYTLHTSRAANTVLQKLHLHPAVALVEPIDC